jgi:hypothetical protein
MTPPKIYCGALWLADHVVPLTQIRCVYWNEASRADGQPSKWRVWVRIGAETEGQITGPNLDSLDETIQWVELVMKAISWE